MLNWLKQQKGPSRDALLRATPRRNKLVRESPVTPDEKAATKNPLGATVLRLTAPLAQTRWQAVLASSSRKGPARREKSFDLDELGAFVWHSIDGTRTVEDVITHFAREKRLNLREAEVAVLTFLQTLTRRGLVGLVVREGKTGDTPPTT
jgi:hypothetical protein